MLRRCGIAVVCFIMLGLMQKELIAQPNPVNTYITDGFVQTMIKSQNYVYLGGQFSSVGKKSGYGLKTAVTGTAVDTLFPIVNGEIYTVVSDGSGGWYIGGAFTRVGTELRNRIARINADGSLHPWNPNVNGTVRLIYPRGNDVFISGTFSTIGSRTKQGFAKISAVTGLADSLWSTNITASGYAVSLVVVDSGMYIAGSFNNIAGVSRTNAAKINLNTGVLDSSWRPNPNNIVASVLHYQGSIIFSGNFTQIGGISRSFLAKVNLTAGAADASFNLSPSTVLSAAYISESDLYVSGGFTTIGGQSIGGFAKIDLQTNTVNAGWNPGVSGTITKIDVVSGIMYISGSFSAIGGQSINGIAQLNPATGVPTSGWNLKPGGEVRSFTVNGNQIYLGGAFTSYNAFQVTNLARIKISTGIVDTTFKPNPNAFIRSFYFGGNALFAAGDFSNIGGVSKTFVAKIIESTGQVDPSWGVTISGTVSPQHVNQIAFNNGSLYISGLFDMVGGITRKYVAKLDSISLAVDNNWNPAPNGIIKTVEASDGYVYVGGDFFSIAGKNTSRLARLRVDNGALDTVWTPNANGMIEDIEIADSSVYIGGAFTSISGQLKGYLMRYSLPSLTPDFTWGPVMNQRVNKILAHQNAVYIAGAFSNPGGVPSSMLARLDRNTGAVNQNWRTNLTGVMLFSLAASNDTLYTAGWFNTVNDMFHPNYAVYKIPQIFPPAVVTLKADSISATSARVSGSVNPNEQVTSYYFQYKTGLSTFATDTMQISAGTSPVIVYKTLTGLIPGTVYSYKIIAFSPGGVSAGVDSTFTTVTSLPPAVQTLQADSIGIYSMRLRGTVNPNGQNTSYYFQYILGQTTVFTDTLSAGNGSTPITVTRYLTGLFPNSAYSYRIIAFNSAGSSQGSLLGSTTLAAPKPIVSTGSANPITQTSGRLHGTINAQGDSTRWYIEYGLTTSYGMRSDTLYLGRTLNNVLVNKLITGLQPNTRYYYRMAAYNSSGLTNGGGTSFVTLAPVLALTSPVGGEGYEPGTTQNITWNAAAVDTLKIEFSSDNGNSWTLVVDNRLTTGGSYNWIVPSIATTEGKIRITSKGVTPQIISMSTGVFTIASSSLASQPTGTDQGLNGNSFPDNNNGTAVGDSGTVINTTNGGTTWVTPPAPIEGIGIRNLNDISTPSKWTRYAAGDSGTVYKSTNAGLSWNSLNTANLQNFYSVVFTDTLTGTLTGSNGTILRTTNGGSNWVAQTSGTSQSLRDIYFTNAATATAVGDTGTILFTSNGGSTWTAQNSGTMQNLHGVWFVKNAGVHQIGYAVGDSGTIVKTTNGGTNWNVLLSPTSKRLNDIAFYTPERGSAVGEGGVVIYTTNGGGMWKSLVGTGSRNINSIAIPNSGGLMFLAGSNGSAFKDTVGIVPVELTSFTASNANGKVILNWVTASELNNAGFEVERAFTGASTPLSHRTPLSPNGEKVFTKIGELAGKGTTVQISEYTFIDNVSALGTYVYRLKQKDYDGTVSYSPEVEITLDAPMEFALSQNYPNPFNPSTQIKYQLPEASDVLLEVYDIQGSLIERLVSGKQEAGYYQVTFDAGKLSTGVYIYRLTAGKYTKTMKLMLMK